MRHITTFPTWASESPINTMHYTQFNQPARPNFQIGFGALGTQYMALEGYGDHCYPSCVVCVCVFTCHDKYAKRLMNPLSCSFLMHWKIQQCCTFDDRPRTIPEPYVFGCMSPFHSHPYIITKLCAARCFLARAMRTASLHNSPTSFMLHRLGWLYVGVAQVRFKEQTHRFGCVKSTSQSQRIGECLLIVEILVIPKYTSERDSHVLTTSVMITKKTTTYCTINRWSSTNQRYIGHQITQSFYGYMGAPENIQKDDKCKRCELNGFNLHTERPKSEKNTVTSIPKLHYHP